MITTAPTQARALPWRPETIGRVLAFLVLLGLAALLDPAAARWAAHLSPGTVHAGRIVSDFGLAGYMLWISGLLTLAAYLARDTDWGRPRWGRLTRLGDRASFFFAAVALSGIAVQVLKHLIGRARPTVLPQQGMFVFHPLSWPNAFASFPSGHTTSVFAAALALGVMLPRWRPLFYVAAVVVAVSRVVVDAHHPSDVVAGAALGMIVATALARSFARGNILLGPEKQGRP